MRRISDTIDREEYEVSIYIGLPNDMNGYFRSEPPSESDVIINRKGHGSFSSFKFCIGLSNIRKFTDPEKLGRDHIEDMVYDKFECILCMSGPEELLYSHENTKNMHFHKDCHRRLAEDIHTLLDNNTTQIVKNEL